ncbi:MAG TPA: hypothetical protein VGM88_03675 [Kofleriaceae bacterium]
MSPTNSKLAAAARKHVLMEGPALDPGEVVVLVVTKTMTFVRRKTIKGRLLTDKEIQLRLAGAEAAIDYVAETQLPEPPPQLSAAEATLLDRANFPTGSAPSALARSRVELELLIRGSFTIDQAAKALAVTTSRIRQRLSAGRTLFGLKEGRGWRIPKFQFASKGKLVRNIDVVLPHVRADAHPLVVKNWFTLPHPDLVIGNDDQRVSPIDWLASGRPADVVAALADEV